MTGRSTGNEPAQTPTRWYGDSKSFFAVFVLIDLPTQTINDMLQSMKVNRSAVAWLAYKGASIPEPGGEATELPIDPSWRSPFVGKSVLDAVEFLNGLPDEEAREVDERHFIVVDDYFLHKGRGLAKAYRIEGGEKDGSELSWVPGKPKDLMNGIYAYRKGQWEEWLDDFKATGWCMAYGEEDGPVTPPAED